MSPIDGASDVAPFDAGLIEAVQEHVHLAERPSGTVGLHSEKRNVSFSFRVRRNGMRHFDQQRSRAAGGIAHAMPRLRIQQTGQQHRDFGRSIELARFFPCIRRKVSDQVFVGVADDIETTNSRWSEIEARDVEIVKQSAQAIAKKHALPVIEDAAQAIGAEYLGRPAGAWGDIGCLSFYPTKNLGGMGDGGMMVCHDTETAAKLRLLASHGMQPRYYRKLVGINSRLDTIQAAILNVKIAHLQSYSDARQKNANRYAELIAASGLAQNIELPYHAPEALQYGIRVPGGMRDSLRKHLTDMGIGNEVYYPVPLHQQECLRDLGYTVGCLPQTEKAAKEILHLPIYPDLTESEQDAVVSGIKRFYASASSRRAA